MALWGANDNLLSPGTVSLDYSSGTVTASVGASFGFVGYGGTGDVIRFGVKGGEGGYEDYFGDAIITFGIDGDFINNGVEFFLPKNVT